jgi:hypothetical protein
MDIFNLDITSISLIGLFKILLKLFDLLADKVKSEIQTGAMVNNGYSAKRGENTALFMKDLYEKTITFLKNNFKKEELLQISENIDWEKQEVIKEPPKQTQSRNHVVR